MCSIAFPAGRVATFQNVATACPPELVEGSAAVKLNTIFIHPLPTGQLDVLLNFAGPYFYPINTLGTCFVRSWTMRSISSKNGSSLSSHPLAFLSSLLISFAGIKRIIRSPLLVMCIFLFSFYRYHTLQTNEFRLA